MIIFLLTWKKLTCVGVCAAGEKACLYSAKCGISRRRATLKKENPRKTFLNFRNNLLMLYKNLPDKELEHVLFIRGILDRVAALVFYLKKDRANARAVMQARREFEDIRYSFAASRIENIMKSTDEMIPERTHFSILMKYYLLGKKHFSQLKLF